MRTGSRPVVITPGFEARLHKVGQEDRAQLDLARKRMGEKPSELLAWILDFAYTDLDTLRPEERQAKGYDLRILPDCFKERPVRQRAKCGESTGRGYVLAPMPEETLRDIHKRLNEGIRRLFAAPVATSWPLPEKKASIYRSSPLGVTHTRFGVVWDSQTEGDAAIHTFAELLLSAGEKLRVCPLEGCGRAFVSNRKQKFCSPGHLQAFWNRERYVASVQAVSGKQVKVASRPRIPRR